MLKPGILASEYCLNNKSGRFFAGLNLYCIEVLCTFSPYFVFWIKKGLAKRIQMSFNYLVDDQDIVFIGITVFGVVVISEI